MSNIFNMLMCADDTILYCAILPCADKKLYLMFRKLLKRAILVTSLIPLHTLVIYRVLSAHGSIDQYVNEDVINVELDKLSKWLGANILALNNSKTKYIFFFPYE